MDDAGRKPIRLPLLDGLRGIAAIFVMVYHGAMSFAEFAPFSRGYLFVDFFFLLSGFVLTLSAEPKMAAGWSPFAFLRARVIRLWPLLAVGVLFGAMLKLFVSGPSDLLPLLVLALLVIPQTGGGGSAFPLNGPQWSLMLEFIGNILHALVLRKVSDSGLLLWIALIGVALIYCIVQTGANDLGPGANNWWLAMPRLTFSYMVGIWFGRHWMAGHSGPLVSWQAAFAAPPLFILLLCYVPLDKALGDVLCTIIVLPALFWLAARAEPPKSAWPWLAWLGSISFPLYVIHLTAKKFSLLIDPSLTSCLIGMLLAIIASHYLNVAQNRIAASWKQRKRQQSAVIGPAAEVARS